jgi:hypothetical protein
MQKRRAALLISLLVVIPLLICALALVLLSPRTGEVYDRCIAALGPEALANPGANALIEGLRRASGYEQTEFNLNRRYKKGTINILMPSGSSRWPTACPIAAQPADCLASAKKGFVICNPAIGKEVASPLLLSGIANVQTLLALRFLTLTFLGHELGHLSFGGVGGKHLLPTMSNAAMPCAKNGPDPNSEEQRADAFGSSLACSALRRYPELALLPTGPGGVLQLQTSLEDALDWEYFQMDDTCAGDTEYPSVSRRKHTFAKVYLQCLYPGQEFNPVAILADRDAKTFDEVERVLRARQKFGAVTSGWYGQASLYSEATVADGTTGYLTFDSSGTRASLWRVAGHYQNWRIQELAEWPKTGRFVASQRSGSTTHILINFDEKSSQRRTLVDEQVECPNASARTCLVKETATVQLAADAQVSVGDNGGVLVRSSHEFLFMKDLKALLSPRRVGGSRLPNLGDPDRFVSAIDSTRAVVIPSDQGGILQTTVLENGRVFQRQMMVTADVADHIESMAITSGRWLFVVGHRPQFGTSSLNLWDCPSDLLSNSQAAITHECAVTEAPIGGDDSAALATRDLSSLFEKNIDAHTCNGIIAVQTQGWLWLVDWRHGTHDVVPAAGLVECGDGYVDTFRTRRIDRQVVHFNSVSNRTASAVSLPVRR